MMNDKVFKKRVLVTSVLFIAIAFAFIFRLFTLHFSDKIIISSKNKYQVRRGYIYDRNGSILAISIETPSLYVNPEKIKNPGIAASRIAPILNMSPIVLKKRMMRKKRFVWLKRQLDEDSVLRIRELKIPGLGFRKEFKRGYPEGVLASQIIGFVGIDNRGLEGIEFSYNDVLMGKGSVSDGGWVSGMNITLTIDRTIQYLAEKELKIGMERCQAKQGAAIVMEVSTGKILALARTPSFDPNFYHKYSTFDRKNFTVTDFYEPGSTMKIFSIGALLSKRPDVLKRSFTCRGKVDIADVTINCTGVHGTIDHKEVLEKSCNVGVIKYMQFLQKKDLYGYLRKFGFGSKVGFEIPGENSGILRTVNEWSGLSKFSISIGYELSDTSLQLGPAFRALGNRGVYNNPSVIEKIEKGDGSIVQSFYPRSRGQVIPVKQALYLKKLLRRVVVNGTGKTARSKYYAVAGKTGTSKKFIKRKESYTDRVLASFVGLAPYKNPRICVLVVYDEPKILKAGSLAAAPVFSKIVDHTLPYLGVGGHRYMSSGRLRSLSKEHLRWNGKTMPNFTGKRIGTSLDLLRLLDRKFAITYSLKGRGRVYKQMPPPGKELIKNQPVELYFRKEE
jgi:cell division protein FtsI (penicillin-binding protein 3)